MELYQLKSFLTIARERNLTRAARALHISQSALSTQIRQLEDEFKVKLFERTSRGMQLTAVGQQLLASAQEVLESAEKLRQHAMSLSRDKGVSIAVGLNTDAHFLKVSAINRRQRQLFPETNLIFHNIHSADAALRLRQGQVDLAFFYGRIQDPDIELTVIDQIRTCVVIPTSLIRSVIADLSWAEVAELPWIWVENLPFINALQQRIGDYRTLPDKAAVAADEQIVRELVEAGQGVAIMREDEARPLVEAGRAVIWNKGWGEVPLNLGWLVRNREQANVKAARETVLYVWRKQDLSAGWEHV